MFLKYGVKQAWSRPKGPKPYQRLFAFVSSDFPAVGFSSAEELAEMLQLIAYTWVFSVSARYYICLLNLNTIFLTAL